VQLLVLEPVLHAIFFSNQQEQDKNKNSINQETEL
jgi:hypothetical protein